MPNETYYFPHDYEPTSDPKIQALLGEYGGNGYGVFWRLVEMLHSNTDHKLPLKSYLFLAIAKQMSASAEQIQAIINYCINTCELFVSDGEYFWSNRVNENFKRRSKISEIRAIAGRKGAIAKQNLAKPGKGKERKGKEIKVKNILSDFSPAFQEAFNNYRDMRVKIKKPMTDKAISMALSKLKELSSSEVDQIAILNQSTFHSWQGLFALKDQPRVSVPPATAADFADQ